MTSSLDRLTSVFRETFEHPTLVITPAMTARDVENWDSFNHINLVIAIESEFKVKFTTKEIKDLANVGDLVNVLRTKGISISW